MPNTETRWVILCRVSGGVTGTREAFLKQADRVEVFPTRAAAQAVADRLELQMNHEHARATFTYQPVPRPVYTEGVRHLAKEVQ